MELAGKRRNLAFIPQKGEGVTFIPFANVDYLAKNACLASMLSWGWVIATRFSNRRTLYAHESVYTRMFRAIVLAQEKSWSAGVNA